MLDLNEILDISEDGICIQSSFPLQVGKTLDLYLDLTESKSPIQATGQVVWTNSIGRAGIRFPSMAEESAIQLKEWIFLNLLTGFVNRLPQQGGTPASVSKGSVIEQPLIRQERSAFPQDFTTLLTALGAVKRQIRMGTTDLDKMLQILAERALSFASASGAAIALAEGAHMVCRASAGPDAPGVGSKVQADSGFSGECIRLAQPLYCEDAETDSRVDRDTCRALGIRSIAATPIGRGDRVSGLIEIFSPRPRAFGPEANLVLEHLAEAVTIAIRRARDPKLQLPDAQPAAEKVEAENAASDGAIRSALPTFVLPEPRSHRGILLVVAGVIFLGVTAWVLLPHRGARGTAASSSLSVPTRTSASTANSVSPVDLGNMESLRKLAAQGDASAQFAVGRHFATGDGVAQDYTEAARWFALAADQGHVLAQETLGAYYWAGRGVPQDLVKAYFWSVLAQAAGDESSKYRVSILASRMTRNQILTAQQQASEWLKEHRISSGSSEPHTASPGDSAR